MIIYLKANLRLERDYVPWGDPGNIIIGLYLEDDLVTSVEIREVD